MRQQSIFSGMEWKLRIKRKYQRWLRGQHKPRSGHILRSHRNASNRLREVVGIVAAALLCREFHCVLWCWKIGSNFDTIEVHTPLQFRTRRWISFLLRWVQCIPVKDVAAHDRSCRCPWCFASLRMDKTCRFFAGSESIRWYGSNCCAVKILRRHYCPLSSDHVMSARHAVRRCFWNPFLPSLFPP